MENANAWIHHLLGGLFDLFTHFYIPTVGVAVNDSFLILKIQVQ